MAATTGPGSPTIIMQSLAARFQFTAVSTAPKMASTIICRAAISSSESVCVYHVPLPIDRSGGTQSIFWGALWFLPEKAIVDGV